MLDADSADLAHVASLDLLDPATISQLIENVPFHRQRSAYGHRGRSFAVVQASGLNRAVEGYVAVPIVRNRRMSIKLVVFSIASFFKNGGQPIVAVSSLSLRRRRRGLRRIDRF